MGILDSILVVRIVLASSLTIATRAASPCSFLTGSTPSNENNVENTGRIEIIVGPMFAGKSTELMRSIRRHNLACRRSLF